MQKSFYYCLLFSSVITHAHTSLQPSHFIEPSPLPWYGVVDKKDLAVAGAVSAAFCGGSFFIQDKKTRAAVQTVAVLVPLVRLLSTMGIVKKTLNNVPLAKEIFGCEAVECQGICNECVMRHTLIDAGIGAALCSLGAPIAQFLSKRVERVKNDKETAKKESEVIKKECNICTEEKEERYCASPVCCKEGQNVICRTCIDSWYKEKGGSYEPAVSCPFCRQNMVCPLPDKEGSQDDTTDTVTDTASEFTENNESKTTPALPDNPLSAFFNKTLLVSGTLTAAGASLLSYADHRPAVKDGAITVACSGVLLAVASKIKDPILQKQLLVAAFIMPFIGLINKSETVRKIGNAIPFLNHVFGCEKQECTSICAHCKLRNACRGAAAFIGLALTAGGL